jgi:hypothetical protein
MIAIGTGIATIAIETAVTTTTIEFIVAEMGTATTAVFIGIGMEIAIEDITTGTGETTDAMIAETMATTGVGTDVAGFTGTAATGFTKRLF